MEEKKLLKLALICSLLGTALLYFISTTIEQEQKPFSFIEDEEYSVISGEISKINTYGNVSFITLYQKMPVDVIIIGENYLDLKQGNTIEVRGTKQDYEGKKEFVADEIRKMQ
ncbi:hypothetical protein KY308_00945 [Candidatus Woesearchaeota archaeon]|nr:hypothetical protein [Candidatus Woesearchaeota archaeon]